MVKSLVWITGASGGLGEALAATAPWEDARIIGISRRPPQGIEHLQVDLADPGSWRKVEASFAEELSGFEGDRVVLIQAAGMLDPMGFAGELDSDTYASNVIVNSAAPQVLGNMFLKAVASVDADRHLVMITSGAASSVYPGWASYGAAKAAVDQWVRDVGAEQDLRGGARVISIAPGTVDTEMQKQLRETDERDFPNRGKFVDLHADGKLTPATDVAAKMWSLLDRPLDNGSVVDLRKLATSSAS